MPEERKRADLKISGMHCASCALNVEKALKDRDDVYDARVNFAEETATVEYDPEKTNLAELERTVDEAGYGVVTSRITLKIGGMVCASCVQVIEAALRDLDGVLDVRVNLATENAHVTYTPATVSVADMKAAIEDAGTSTSASRERSPKTKRSVHGIRISATNYSGSPSGLP